jgi:hypothetical protein
VSVILGDAESIDVEQKRVQLADGGTLTYDLLVVATGATHSYFGHPEWEQFAPGLKTIDDALEIRRRVLLAFEAAERESDPAVQKAADVRRHRRRSDRRRARGRALRDRTADDGARLPPHPSRERARDPARRP